MYYHSVNNSTHFILNILACYALNEQSCPKNVRPKIWHCKNANTLPIIQLKT